MAARIDLSKLLNARLTDACLTRGHEVLCGNCLAKIFLPARITFGEIRQIKLKHNNALFILTR